VGGLSGEEREMTDKGLSSDTAVASMRWEQALAIAIGVVEFGVGAVLVMSALPKIREPWMFVRIVSEYHIPIPWVPELTASFLPWVEASCGVCLIGGIARRGALLLAAAMFMLLTLVLASAVLRGMTVDCGCFGVHGGSQTTGWAVLRTASLALLTIGVLRVDIWKRRRTRPTSLDSFGAA